MLVDVMSALRGAGAGLMCVALACAAHLSKEARGAEVTGPSYAGAAASPSTPFHWSGHAASGATIEIRVPRGSIRGEPSTGDVVEIDARVHGRDRDVPLTVAQDERGVRLVVPEAHDFGVDVVVRLPADRRFVAHTTNGTVETRELADVDAHTVNGSIDIDRTRRARAADVNGSIRVSFTSTDWSEPLSLSTVNGDIDVTLPAKSNVDRQAMHLRTVNGRVRVAAAS